MPFLKNHTVFGTVLFMGLFHFCALWTECQFRYMAIVWSLKVIWEWILQNKLYTAKYLSDFPGNRIPSSLPISPLYIQSCFWTANQLLPVRQLYIRFPLCLFHTENLYSKCQRLLPVGNPCFGYFLFQSIFPGSLLRRHHILEPRLYFRYILFLSW